jgi:hypothetical protein
MPIEVTKSLKTINPIELDARKKEKDEYVFPLVMTPVSTISQTAGH